MTDVQSFSIWSVRAALGLFFVFAVLMLAGWMRDDRWRRLRWLWTLAVAAYGIHVVTAFAFFHDWSHAQAVAHTAAVTEKFTGIRWGGGIWFNHLFSAVCVVETLWWWIGPRSFAVRARWFSLSIYTYLIFIILNASILFVAGGTRWIYVLAAVVLLLYALRMQRPRRRS